MTPKRKGRPNEQPGNNVTVKQAKDTYFTEQRKVVYVYWYRRLATAAMVSRATKVPHKNICRYKRELEKAGHLFEIKTGICRHTKRRAMYCTTNPELAEKLKACNGTAGEKEVCNG